MTGRGKGGKGFGKGGTKRQCYPKCLQYFHSLWNGSHCTFLEAKLFEKRFSSKHVSIVDLANFVLRELNSIINMLNKNESTRKMQIE